MIPLAQPNIPPSVLLPYQAKTIKQALLSSVLFIEKSRRIGLTWGISAHAVLTAASAKSAGGMKVFYIGFNLDMTKEFIDTCAMWAKNFKYAASEVEEFIFKDDDEKEIQAFRIRFDSGFEILALTSRPRSLRGRQGLVIIDEAAFHDDLPELMKAALALLIWGGKVVVISTHDGADNPFNKYIQDIRAGKEKFDLITITFNDALKDGLYERICYTKGEEYTKAGEQAWAQEIIDFYGDGAEEELFCIPRKSAGAYFPSLLVEQRMEDIPVIAYECSDEFVYKSEVDRTGETLQWLKDNIDPYLSVLDKKIRHAVGGDFARSGDLSVLWPVGIDARMRRVPPFILEMRNVPFAQQKQIIWYILDGLPRFEAGAFDARGNGQQLAEETMQKYGANRIYQVMSSPAWYLDAFPKYKAGLEDGTVVLAKSNDISDDHRLVTVKNGVPGIPDKRTIGTDKKKRHGDSVIAAVLAFWASIQDPVIFGYDPVSAPRATSSLRPNDKEDDDLGMSHAFGNATGAW